MESNQISVNNFDTQLIKYEKVENQTYYGGTFKFDVEKNMGNVTKKLKSSGKFTGVIDEDSTIHMEYIGDNFKLVTKTSKTEEENGNISYLYEQVMTVDGITSNMKKTFKIPEKQTNANKELSANVTQYENLNSLATSKTKVKVNLPSLAPPGATLVYNNVQYTKLLYTAGIIVAIAEYFKMGQVAALGLVGYAVSQAIPSYLNINTDDIYIDIFLVIIPIQTMYAEVDYYYKYV